LTKLLNCFLRRSNPRVKVFTLEDGAKPLRGSMKLSFAGESTSQLPHDLSASSMKYALESLKSIGTVHVTRYENHNGHVYFITFLTELGNIGLINVDYSQTTGPDAKVAVASIQDGILPSSYGFKDIGASDNSYKINNLINGKEYQVQVRCKGSEGYGGTKTAIPSPIAPKQASDQPRDVTMFALNNKTIRIRWSDPEHNGGHPITAFKLQWDISPDFLNHLHPGFETLIRRENGEQKNCFDLNVDYSTNISERFVRIFAFNEFAWSNAALSSPESVLATNLPPGKVESLRAIGIGGSGIFVSWEEPNVNDDDECEFGGNGGSAISDYLIEWSTRSDFDGAHMEMVNSFNKNFTIGGKHVFTGIEKEILDYTEEYFVRVTAFNAFGAGISATLESPIYPLDDSVPSSPTISSVLSISAIPASSVFVNWVTPSFDGGQVIKKYVLEYSASKDFYNSSNIDIPVATERQAVIVESSEVVVETHLVRATVNVLNEKQMIETNFVGVDEIQTITTTANDVIPEVQSITTSALDNDEEQVIVVSGEDVNEVQVVRSHNDDVAEVQSVKVFVERVHEVQKLGFVIQNINTNGSISCLNQSVGESCDYIDDSIEGEHLRNWLELSL